MKCKIAFSFSILFVFLSAVVADETETDFINVIDKIDSDKSIQLFGGLSIERVDNVGGSALPSMSDPILDKVQRYFETHELKVIYPNENVESGARSKRPSTESRTRKLKKILLPLMLALKLKLAIVVPLMLLVIKAISLKALAAGVLALLLSGASFFKDLISKKKDHITTAYITGAPLNAEIVHTDWNRNGQAAAQELAYNYHTIPQSSY